MEGLARLWFKSEIVGQFFLYVKRTEPRNTPDVTLTRKFTLFPEIQHGTSVYFLLSKCLPS